VTLPSGTRVYFVVGIVDTSGNIKRNDTVECNMFGVVQPYLILK